MRNDVMRALRSALSPVFLLGSNVTVLAAVSGGADSIALLHGLALLRKEENFSLHVLHVEHGLRGEDSLQDASFVQGLCKRLDLPLFLYHAALPGTMDSPGAEARAREARLGYFAKAMESCGAHALLTAHHQDDQAETVLMRLLRGAGAKGLGAMRATSDFGHGKVLRPFLSLPKKALLQFLEEIGEDWQEDKSNQEPCCLRNQLRLEVLPVLEAFQPGAVTHMAQTAERLQMDEDCLSALSKQLLACAIQPWPACQTLSLSSLLDAPPALRIRALRDWVKGGMQGEACLSYEDTLGLYRLVTSSQRGGMNLPMGLRATRTDAYLHLSRQDGLPLCPSTPLPAVSLSLRSSQYALGTFSFCLSPLQPEESLPDGREALVITQTLLEQGLVLRPPRPGDTIHPFGAPGSKALRRYFTDHKVDAPFRSAWPLLARGNEVLWIAGIGASEKTRLFAQADQPLWKLTLQTPLPQFNQSIPEK